jgi:hypothetical protein
MDAVVANVEPLGEEEIEAAGVEAEMGQWGAPEEWSRYAGPSIQRSAADGLSLFEPWLLHMRMRGPSLLY